MKVLKALTAARELITPRERWTRGAYARDKEGRGLLSGDHSGAVCFCLVGAAERASPDFATLVAMRVALRRAAGGDAAIFNDTHAHIDVLALLDRAIATEEAQLQAGA